MVSRRVVGRGVVAELVASVVVHGMSSDRDIENIWDDWEYAGVAQNRDWEG